MSAPGPAGGYAPTASFESGRVTAMAADDRRVVLGTRRGTVEIVAADDRTTVEFDAPVEDLAAGDRVYVLADGAVTALSTAGTRVWSVELPEASQLVALPEAGVLGAVTAEELVGFDSETGGEEFRADRPHADVTDDPGFVGAGGAFVLSAWSFLAVWNVDGTARFDRNLDGAIESVGIVDDTVVASLKDERVVGVDVMTGDKQWERELAVTDLPGRGVDALLFTAEGQLVSLDPDGTYTTVADLPSGDVYPASDGHLFCAVSDGTVAVYCSTGDPAEALDVSAEDELVPGETDAVELEVTNAGERPVSGVLRAEGEGVALRDAEREVDLAPGERASVSLGVASVAADDTAAIAVEADGDHLASVSLPVTTAPGGALAVDATLESVTDGSAALAITVENAGDAPATDVSVSPGDAGFERLAPGERATAAVETPFDPGAVVPVAVRADGAEADAEVALSDRACEVGVETTGDGFVDVTVENRTDAALADDLAVAGDPFEGTVERRVDLPAGGRFVLALRPDRPVDDATVEASLVGLHVAESVEVGALDAPTGRGGGDAGARPPESGPSRGSRSADRHPTEGRASSRRDEARPHRDGADYRRDDPDRRRRVDSDRRGRDAPGRRPTDDSGGRPRGDRDSRRRDRDGRRDADRRRDRDDRPRDRPREDARGSRREDRPGRRDDARRRDDRRSTDAGREDRPPRDRGRDAASDVPSAGAAPGDSRDGGGAAGGTGPSGAGSPSAGSSGAAGGAAGGPTGGTPSGSAGAAAGGTALSADRALEDTDPDRTQGVRERVTVTNEGEETAEDVTVSFDDETADIGDLSPGESVAVERHHSFTDTGPAEIPAGTVTAANADEVTLDARRLSVSSAELAADVEVAVDDGYRVRVELANHRDVACEIDRIGVREFGVWNTDLRVPAGESVEWTRPVDAPAEAVSAVEAAVEYTYEDRGEQAHWGTLARVPDASAEDPEGTAALSVSVGEETRVSGGYGSVVLVVENVGASPAEDVSVAADGEAVSDLMYAGGESVDRLAPGETLTHFVDVETEGEATVPVSLSVADEDEEVVLSGPAPANEDDWSAAKLDAWRVEREGDADAGSSHFATPFERV